VGGEQGVLLLQEEEHKGQKNKYFERKIIFST
jgi:hypothetical protein